MTTEMLINAVQKEECRIAIVRDGHLAELYVERASSASQVGNIYKGRITNVEPSIQAAFVDFGMPKNGFLHVSDVHPQYFPKGQREESEAVGRKRPHRSRPPIQACLRRGQEVVVQMTKAGIGTKGPTLTTYLSVPGRLLVLMPGMNRTGISRKVEDEEARAKARATLNELKLPENLGIIIRTQGTNSSKRDLQRDLNYLTRLWKSVEQQINSAKAPAEIYRESDLVIRTIRDVYNADIQRIICDDVEVAEKVRDFLQVAVPRSKSNLEIYTGSEGLFHDFGLEAEMERMYARRVELPSGGSLIIDQAEALVAIDVNSGRYRDNTNAEMTALKTNQEAAAEIARQLRLRDLGGVIIIDFIDQRDIKNRRKVDRALRDAMKDDRAKTKTLPMSSFGIVQMTRQRVRPSLKDSIYSRCEHCDGAGLIKSQESQALLVLRNLKRACGHDQVDRVEVTVVPDVAEHLANRHRRDLARLEEETTRKIVIHGDHHLAGGEISFHCLDARGNDVPWELQPDAAPSRGQVRTVPIDKYRREEPRTRQGEPQKPSEKESKPEPDQQANRAGDKDEGDQPKKKSRRRGRRGGRRSKKSDGGNDKDQPEDQKQTDDARKGQPGQDGTRQQDKQERKTQGDQSGGGDDGGDQKQDAGDGDQQASSGKKSSRRRRGRRGGRKHRKSSGGGDGQSAQPPGEDASNGPSEQTADGSSGDGNGNTDGEKKASPASDKDAGDKGGHSASDTDDEKKSKRKPRGRGRPAKTEAKTAGNPDAEPGE